MTDLDELYQQIIVDHARAPRNAGSLTGEGVHSEAAYNPLCGDRVTVYVDVGPDDVLRRVAFEGEGCAISQASASLMTELVTGLDVSEAIERFEAFRHLVTDDSELDPARFAQLDGAAALAGVRDYPMRVKCATLAWHALRALLARASLEGEFEDEDEDEDETTDTTGGTREP